MDLGASQKFVIFGYNVFAKNWFYIIGMGFVFLNQKRLQHRVFWTKKYMDVKSTYRYFWKSTQNKSKYTLKSLLSQNMVHFT